MAKQPRTKISGKEARYILHQNHINLAWLAEQLDIKPQSMNSRLYADEFKIGYQMEINKVTGKRIFDVDADEAIRTILDNLKGTDDETPAPNQPENQS